MKINPTKIDGPWRKGFALERHVISSEYIGDNEFGYPQFDTTRSEIGELLYKLKYRSDQSVVDQIVSCAVEFLKELDPDVDLLIPATPSKRRTEQPVFVIGEQITSQLQIDFSTDFVTRRAQLR